MPSYFNKVVLLLTIALFLNIKSSHAAYCIPSNPPCGNTGNINVVKITGTNFNNVSNGCSAINGPSYTIFAPSVNTTETLTPGNTYQFSIATNSGLIVSIWIDYNQNQVFETTEWTQVTVNSVLNVASLVNITIPITATSGLTGLRVRSRATGNSNGPGDACSAFGSGEAEDYTITIGNSIPCTAPPAAGSTIVNVTSICYGDNVTFSLANATNASGVSYQWQASGNTSTWGSISGAISPSYASSIFSSNYYRCMLTCSGISSYSTPIYASLNPINLCYCSSGAGSSISSDIGRVVLGSITNGIASPEVYNASATKTYSDFTALQPADLDAGGYYQMAVSQICSGAFSNAYVLVYADWNQDGIFTFPNEYTLLGQSSSNSGGNVVLGGIFVPNNAQLGVTRLRIILTENGSQGQAACGTYNVGETEDYRVNVVAPSNCSSQPPSGFAYSSSSAICGSAYFTLSLGGGSTNTAASYYWESSYDNFNWTILPASVSYTIIQINQTQSSYYRCVTNCGGFVATSAPVYVASNALQNCYCTSFANNANFSDIGNVNIGSINNGVATPSLGNLSATSTYTDYSQVTPPNLEVNSTYPIWVSQISNSTVFRLAYAYAYIDFNQDAVFDGTESFYLGQTNSNPSGNLLNNSIYIPSFTALGLTKMRIVLSEATVPSACGNYGYGETEDYLVNIVTYTPCVGLPNAGTTVGSTPSVCPSVPVLLSLSGNSSGGGITYQWQLSSDSINWFDYPGAVSSTFSTNQNSLSFYRCVLTCDSLSATSTPISILQKSPSLCYCYSGAAQNTYTDIGQVSIGTLSNGSIFPVTNNSAAVNSYSDFTNLPPTNLEAGGTYSIAVSQISFSANFFSSYVKAFIDFDQDGFFASNESFYVGGPTFSPQNTTLNSFITVPSTAYFGNTRMRIVLSESSSVATACDFYNFGETEDYLVNIIPATPCVSPLVGGIALSSDTSICTGTSISLSLSGNSGSPSVSYQWQYSYDTINWTTIQGANWQVYSTYIITSAYYRCVLTCNGTSANSTSILISLSAASQCYCASYAASSLLNDIGNVQFGALNNGVANPVINNSTSTKTYSDFTSITSPNMVVGTTYNLKVSQISSAATISAAYIYAFFDFNLDGFFTTGSESFYIGLTSTAAGGNIVSANIPIPISAALGLIRMRIVLIQGSSSAMPCGAYNNGETEDYTINIVANQACTAAVFGGNAVASDTSLCVGTQLVVSLQNNSNFPSQTFQWQSSFDNLNWSNIAGANFTTLNSTFSQPIYYRCVITCSSFSSTSTKVFLQSKIATKCYCASSATNVADDDIGNVKFVNLNNGTASPAINNSLSTNLYSDFTSLSPQAVVTGGTYPITVSQINSGGFFVSRIKVYVDFNQNGTFEIATELFDLGLTSSVLGGNVRTGNIFVPFTAIAGLTRMRVVLHEGSTAAANPCGTYSWGETEDYTISILQNQNCTSLPLAGNAYSSAASVCKNSPFTLYIAGNSSALGQNYRWQYSLDGLTWTYMGNVSLDSSFITTQTNALYYRCAITCSSLTSFSVPVFVSMLQSPVCGYCTNIGGTSCPSNTKITHVIIQGTTLSNTDTLCYSVNGSAVGIFPFGDSTTATLLIGNTYLLSVTSTQNVSKGAWIDLNQDGNFASDEYFAICNSSISGVADTALVTIPWGSTGGPTGLRIRTRINGTSNGSSDACSFFGSGETEDYTIFLDIANNQITKETMEDFALFPNPAKNYITLLSKASETSPYKLVLKNIVGEIILEKRVAANEIKLNINDLSKGIYILELRNGATIRVKKVVKE